MSERFAIYYAPSVTSPLWDRAASWLGRDPASGNFWRGRLAGISAAERLSIAPSPRPLWLSRHHQAADGFGRGQGCCRAAPRAGRVCAQCRSGRYRPLVLADLDGFSGALSRTSSQATLRALPPASSKPSSPFALP